MILPYKNEHFSEYRTKSVQEFRFELSQSIRSQIFFATFVKNIETHIKSNAMTKALKQLIHQQVYHFHVSRVLRSRGQSSVESAAYRAGERLEDRYYGKIADYTAKGGVICSEILAPDYVPEPFHNREYLWNAVEEIEKHLKAQLAYSFDFALQNEFSLEENITITRQFVLENFVAKGMIVDTSICTHFTYRDMVKYAILC